VILVLIFQILIFPFIKAFLRFTLLYLYHLFLVKKIYLDTGIYSIKVFYFLPETRIYITQIWIITICVVFFNQIRKKLVIFVHFKGFNISQKPKSSHLSYFAQKTSLNLAPNWYPIIFTCPFWSDSCSLSDCPVPVKTDVGQVDLVLRLSDGTSEKIRFPNVPVRWTN
jgi:hypothetical protein